MEAVTNSTLSEAMNRRNPNIFKALFEEIYQFITNNFRLTTSSIAEFYKQQWQIELFFKWIKQNLKIKSFLGTSENVKGANIFFYILHVFSFLCYAEIFSVKIFSKR